jgi:hypothetical protein
VTDRIALVLACLIGAAILADIFLNSGTALMFLIRKLMDMVEYLSIWR